MVSLRSGARPLILHGLHSFFFRLQIAYVDGICIFKWPTIMNYLYFWHRWSFILWFSMYIGPLCVGLAHVSAENRHLFVSDLIVIGSWWLSVLFTSIVFDHVALYPPSVMLGIPIPFSCLCVKSICQVARFAKLTTLRNFLLGLRSLLPRS